MLSLLRKVDEQELGDLLFQFGERRSAKRLSRFILQGIDRGLIQTTTDLARTCARVAGRWGRIHPATRVFLALRSTLNDETGALSELLDTVPLFLARAGRMAVISFHSLEDGLVKRKFLAWEQGEHEGKTFRRVNRKPIEASAQEVRENPRARSAKLRVLERVA